MTMYARQVQRWVKSGRPTARHLPGRLTGAATVHRCGVRLWMASIGEAPPLPGCGEAEGGEMTGIWQRGAMGRTHCSRSSDGEKRGGLLWQGVGMGGMEEATNRELCWNA